MSPSHGSFIRSFCTQNQTDNSEKRIKRSSKGVLLLWIIFVIYVSCLSCFLVCSLQPCGHLLRKGLPLGSFVCDGGAENR